METQQEPTRHLSPMAFFYPNAQKSSDPPGQFSSIGSFGAGKDKNTTTPAANKSDSLRKSRDRKSSSNIEEAYSDDGFDEESMGQSQLNPRGSIDKKPSVLLGMAQRNVANEQP